MCLHTYRRKLLAKEESLRKQLQSSSMSSPSFSPLADPSPHFSSSPASHLSSYHSPTPHLTTTTSSFSPTVTSYPYHVNNSVTSSPTPRAVVGREETHTEDVDALLAMEAEEFDWNDEEMFSSLNSPEVTCVYETSAPVLPQQPTLSSGFTGDPSSAFCVPLSGDSSPLSVKKKIFKPPFLQSGGGSQQDSSFGRQSSSSSFNKLPGHKAPRDDSSEFRGYYQHTREMYKIFNQV